MTKILLIEDDKSLGPILQETLLKEGYTTTLCQTIAQSKENSFDNFDLILLDWMLPDGQGVDLLKDIGDKCPVIMLTARTELIDKVLGLESGACDYITKPFEPRELLARIRVQLRKPQTNEKAPSKNFISNTLHLNINERSVLYNKQDISFTKMEFDLLYLLATHAKRVFSREKLLDEVWGYENYPTTRTVDTHVLQIRQKIKNNIIDTVRGVGYRFNPDHEK